MAARKQKQGRMSAQVVEDEDYQLRYEVVAGIEVAEESAVVCVRLPPAAGRKHRRSHLQAVPATVPAITELAAELKAPGVQMVPVEAASDYWRVWFAVLEEAGLAVQLVSSSQARNLPGRPETGKEDARWIARLTGMGMLRSWFVPPPQIRALRVYTRHIWDLTADRTRCWQRLEKLLEDALCKLSAVVSRLAGHQTARAVIEAMIAGERDPRVLAALGQGKMRNDKLPALAGALPGMRSGPEHVHAAASLLRAIDLLEAELRELQERVTAHLAAIPASWGVDADGVTGPGAGRTADAAALPAAGRLDEVPGLGREAAAALIAGIGLDMSRFPTRRRWCPGPGSPRPRSSPGLARAAGRRGTATPTPSGSPSWPLTLRRTRTPSPGSGSAASPPGPAAAGGRRPAAVGRSILIIVWYLLNDPAARYRDLGSDWHARHTDRSRKARNARRQLEALGYDVIMTLWEDAA